MPLSCGSRYASIAKDAILASRLGLCWAERERRMAQSLLAVIAAAAACILLIVPDDASARAGGARGARPVGIHHGGAAIIVRRPVVHQRGAVLRGGDWRIRQLSRRAATIGSPDYGFGGGFDGGGGYGGGGYGGAGCYQDRVQINDDYGWRVREVTVCPGAAGGGPASIGSKSIGTK